MIGIATDGAIAEQKDLVSNITQQVDILDRQSEQAEARADELVLEEVEQYKEQEGLELVSDSVANATDDSQHILMGEQWREHS